MFDRVIGPAELKKHTHGFFCLELYRFSHKKFQVDWAGSLMPEVLQMPKF